MLSFTVCSFTVWETGKRSEGMKLAAVIFDMDGVMFDTERLAFAAWEKACNHYGYPFPRQLLIRCVGHTLEDTRELFRREVGDGFDFDAVYEYEKQSVLEYIEREGVPVKPGLSRLLDFLDRHCIAKAVATSTGRNRAERMIAAAGFSGHFDTVVYGDQVARGKPAPDIFLMASAALNRAPRECVVLEDSENGIRAAHAASMIPILVLDILQPSPDVQRHAHAVCESLDEAYDVLSSMALLETP
jgi:HAD superfamily hydrolase (TIGR01509 family)